MQIGDRVGPYEIQSFLAAGGMAQVFKVWNTGLTRHEAMKIPFEHLLHDSMFKRQFLDGARFAARLRHDNIATIFAVSEEDAAHHFFTMELIEGADLSALLKEKKLTPDESIAILDGIAQALDFAHENGIIHRDIKPPNVLLEKRGPDLFKPKVVDFGIARAMEDSGGTRMTRSGSIMGTPEYMSPEQAGSGATVGPPTDVYSFGVMSYQMLCGETPFFTSEGTSPMAVLVKHLHTPPPPPSSINPDLPFEVDQVLLSTLNKDPDLRPVSCREVLEQLKAALAAPVQATFSQPLGSIPELQQTFAAPAASSTSHAPLQSTTVTPAVAAQQGASLPSTPISQPPGAIQTAPRRSNTPVLMVVGLLAFIPLVIGAGFLGWSFKAKLFNPNGSDANNAVTIVTPEPSPETPTPEPAATVVATEPGSTDIDQEDPDEKSETTSKKARSILNRVAAQTEDLAAKINTQKITFAEFDRQEKILRTKALEALTLAKQAVALDSDNEDAWLEQSRAYFYLGNYKDAQKTINQAKANFPGTDEFALLEAKVKAAQKTP